MNKHTAKLLLKVLDAYERHLHSDTIVRLMALQGSAADAWGNMDQSEDARIVEALVILDERLEGARFLESEESLPECISTIYREFLHKIEIVGPIIGFELMEKYSPLWTVDVDKCILQRDVENIGNLSEYIIFNTASQEIILIDDPDDAIQVVRMMREAGVKETEELPTV